MTRPNDRRFLRLLALGLTGALALSACGGDDDDGGGAAATTAAGAPAATTAAAQGDADPDGVVRVGYDLEAASRGGFKFDPAEVTTNYTDNGLFYLVYGRMMRVTQTGELAPDLAESATLVDATTIDIVLRDGVTFQDGSPFDAEAVKKGLERNLLKTGSPAFPKGFFELKSIEVTAPDALTLSIPNGTAASWYDTFMGGWETTVVKEGTDFTLPVGAGPMKVTEFVPGQKIVLEKWDGYWDADSIRLGGMELQQLSVAQPQLAVTSIKADQIDVAASSSSQLGALTGDLGAVVTPDPSNLAGFMVCKREGPLADVRVRQAVNKAIDRQTISDVLFAGTAEPATELWPEGHRFFDPSIADDLAYDPEGARKLLAEAGYANGASFDLYVLQGQGMPATAEAIQQMLAEVGVTINLIASPDYVQQFLVAKPPGAGLVSSMGKGRIKLQRYMGATVANTCGYSDPEFDALAKKLDTVSESSDEAVDAWHAVQKKAVDDALDIFVAFLSGVTAYSTERVGQLATYPDVIVIPDARETYMTAS